MRGLPGPEALTARRLAALEQFEHQPLPTTALEDWRYSRVQDLDLERYRPIAGGPARVRVSPLVLPSPVTELVASLGEPSVQIVVVDGSGVVQSGADPAVTVTRLVGEPWPVGSVAGRPDAFATLNEAFSAAPLLIQVAPGQVLRRPIVIVQWTGTDGAATFARTVVQVAPGAQATVVEIHASSDLDALTVPVTELDAADGSDLRYAQIQLLGPRVWQIAHLASRAGRDASVSSAAVAFGGAYARLRTAASLPAPGSRTRQLAVYFGTGRQVHDFSTVQDHQAPHTTSELLCKGVVGNRAQGVYTGLIRVARGAKGTDAYQTNRNLVLHEGAHADSVPNLEIEDNDVRCSHASAVGPISEDQRFYLESRGVPPGAANRLITLGFLGEILAELPGVPSSAVLAQAVMAKLAEAEQAEAALAGAGRGRR